MAVRFDADGEDYNQATTFSNGTFSACGWVRIDVDRNDFSTFLDFSSAGVNAFGIQTDTGGVQWQMYSSTGGQTNLFTATVGVWYFLAVSKGTGASQAVAYWADVNTLALSTLAATHAQNNSISGIFVGESGFSAEWLNGSMAAVKIWSGVQLTQAEFENERFQYLPHRTANLYSFWPLLQGGAVAGAQQDFSGAGNNLSGGMNSATTDGPPIPWRQNARQLTLSPEDEVMKGTEILDFGPYPGKSDASVVVTGQSAIVSGSLVEAWIRPDATADHTADEHMVETLHVFAGNIIAGTGFTIFGVNTSEQNEPEGKGTRIYGQWRVAWAWA